MRELQSEITIDAPAARVWAVLTDFAAYSEWNPFLERVSGSPTAGSRLTIRFHPPGSRATTLRPTLLRAEPDRELRWRGRVLLPGVLDAEHSLLIEPLGADRVRFVQSETFSGLLLPLFGGTQSNAERGFAAMNTALKERVEEGGR